MGNPVKEVLNMYYCETKATCQRSESSPVNKPCKGCGNKDTALFLYCIAELVSFVNTLNMTSAAFDTVDLKYRLEK